MKNNNFIIVQKKGNHKSVHRRTVIRSLHFTESHKETQLFTNKVHEIIIYHWHIIISLIPADCDCAKYIKLKVA